MTDISEHWDEVYRSKADTEFSWYEADPSVSFQLVRNACADPAT